MRVHHVIAFLLTVGGVLALSSVVAPTAAAATLVTPFADVRSAANSCESVRIEGIDPVAGVNYGQLVGQDDLDFPVTLPYDSSGAVRLRATAAEGYTISGPADYTLKAPAECFPSADVHVQPQYGTSPTWCSADPDSAIAVSVEGAPILENENFTWRLVPLSTDPHVAAVATGSLPPGVFLGNVSIARPAGLDPGRYLLEFELPGSAPGFPVDSLLVLAADCVELDLGCGEATFTNPDTNGDATVYVLPAGEGFPAARLVAVPSGESASIDVSDLTNGFGWVARGPDGEIGGQALIGPSAACVLRGTRPVITGTPSLGRTLRVRVGDWEPAPVRLSYRWYRDGRRIAGAVDASYRLTFADLGHRVTVKVTGRKDGYADVTLTSSATEPVRWGRFFPPVPVRR